MAIVRTTPSPSCCCTSSVRIPGRRPRFQRVVDLGHGVAGELHVDDRADDLHDFRCSSVNLFLLRRARSLVMFVTRSSKLRPRAADDLDDFLRDRRLARLVVDRAAARRSSRRRCRSRSSSRPCAPPCSQATFSTTRLVDQRLDVAHQQLRRAARARPARRCSPSDACILSSRPHRARAAAAARPSGAWRHRVDELVVDQVHLVDLAFLVYASSMTLIVPIRSSNCGVVAEVRGLADDVAADAAEEALRLVADQRRGRPRCRARRDRRCLLTSARLNRLVFRPPHSPRSVETTM